ncbi:MAG: glycosyltransferase family 4 protein [Micavibrio sp.]
MKILFVIKTLTYSAGGAERMVSSLAGALSKNNDVHLLTFDDNGAKPFYPLDPAVRRHFVSTHSAAKKTGLFEYPSLLLRLRRQIRDIRPDIVVAFMHSAFVPVQCALLGTGIKVVLSEHTVPAYYQTRKLEFFLLRFFGLFASAATVSSECIRKLYPWPLRNKMTVLPNIIDSDFIRPASTAMEAAKKRILSVGRLNADKDHAVLIEAYALLAHDFPDWELVILGEGEERLNLERRIEAHGLQGRIKLPGTTQDMDVAYKQAQIFVQPSRYESFGLVTAEAMTHGLPAIGFEDCSGTNEIIIQEYNGLLVAKRSADSLAASLKLLLQSPSLRGAYGDNAYEYAVANFSKENVVAAWMDYLAQICGVSSIANGNNSADA